jgi:hypothetical protein
MYSIIFDSSLNFFGLPCAPEPVGWDIASLLTLSVIKTTRKGSFQLQHTGLMHGTKTTINDFKTGRSEPIPDLK